MIRISGRRSAALVLAPAISLAVPARLPRRDSVTCDEHPSTASALASVRSTHRNRCRGCRSGGEYCPARRRYQPEVVGNPFPAVYIFRRIPFGPAASLMFRFGRIALGKPEVGLSLPIASALTTLPEPSGSFWAASSYCHQRSIEFSAPGE
jgi:hypothetical protein